MVLWRCPRIDLYFWRCFVICSTLLSTIVYYLFPRMFYCFVFLSQLSQNISKIDLRLWLLRLKFQWLLAIIETFFKLVHLHVHDSQVCMCIHVGIEWIEMLWKYQLLFVHKFFGRAMRRKFNHFFIVLDSFLIIFSLGPEITNVHIAVCENSKSFLNEIFSFME